MVPAVGEGVIVGAAAGGPPVVVAVIRVTAPTAADAVAGGGIAQEGVAGQAVDRAVDGPVDDGAGERGAGLAVTGAGVAVVLRLAQVVLDAGVSQAVGAGGVVGLYRSCPRRRCRKLCRTSRR